MTFFEAMKETGKVRFEAWGIGRYFQIDKNRIFNENGAVIDLLSWSISLATNNWLPYHEPKPCEACELLKQFEGAASNTLRAVKLLLKNPAVHDDGCKEKP